MILPRLKNNGGSLKTESGPGTTLHSGAGRSECALEQDSGDSGRQDGPSVQGVQGSCQLRNWAALVSQSGGRVKTWGIKWGSGLECMAVVTRDTCSWTVGSKVEDWGKKGSAEGRGRGEGQELKPKSSSEVLNCGLFCSVWRHLGA